MTATSHSRASLMSLPIELRNDIYSYLAIEDEPINGGIAYTCETHFEWILLSRPPPLASVNKQLRHEVLQVYYSVNKFLLGDDTCRFDPCFCSGSVDDWRRYLGQYACHLRDVKIVTANLQRQWNPAETSCAKRGRRLSTRARFLQDGTIGFEQSCRGIFFCVCFLRRQAAKCGIQSQDVKNGRQLLVSLEIWVKNVENPYCRILDQMM